MPIPGDIIILDQNNEDVEHRQQPTDENNFLGRKFLKTPQLINTNIFRPWSTL